MTFFWNIKLNTLVKMLQNGGQIIAEEHERLDIRGGQSVGRHLHALVNLMGGLIDIRAYFLQLT